MNLLKASKFGINTKIYPMTCYKCEIGLLDPQ